MLTISLCNWDEFQHYKDRDPPWIKLYRDILTTESWVLGTDTSRLVQVASMLLAVRYKNQIPLNWPLLKKVSSLDCTEKQFREAVEHLEATGFLKIEGKQEVTEPVSTLAQPASTTLATCTSDQSRSEESREEGEQIREPVPQERDVGPVDRVFDHWRTEHGHPRASLDPKRRRVIQAALKGYDESTLCTAISGYRNSSHHMGENDRRTVYDDIELFLRDAKHIEAGLHFARGPPAPALSPVEQARQKLRQSVNGHHGRVVSEQSGTGEGGVGQAAGLLR